MPVHVVGSIEGIVRRGDVVGENSSKKFGVFPFSFAHGVGELRAVNADLPGKQAVRFQLGLAELGDGGFVAAGQLLKGEAAVLVEKKILITALGGSQELVRRTKRIVDVLEQD